MCVVINDITIDSADPKSHAEFWSAALEWKVEYVGEWDAQITLAENVAQSGESWSSITTNMPNVPRLVFAKVSGGKTVKNRIHFDLNADDMDSEGSRLVDLGASVVEGRERVVPGRKERGQDVWTVMQDPEGNEFCVGS